ncbi:MarR family winged helix-turn-helix transcriptional regulator [Blautia schinkii]|nr:MarR family winged helix-turn-helix transcriptional regulator [Blautia schinkii]
MERKHIVGYEIHTLDNMLGRMISAHQSKLTEKQGLTQMQSWIIDYLYKNRDKDLFQKDIEAQFRIARSTATGILKLMEKKGFLTREPHPTDARLKRLVLTEKGIALQLAIMHSLEEVEHKLKDGLTQEQLDSFFEVVHLIKQNIELNIKYNG